MLNKIRLKARFRNNPLVWRFNTRHARKLFIRQRKDDPMASIDTWRFKNNYTKDILKNGITTTQFKDFFWHDPDWYNELKEYMQGIETKYENPMKPFLIEYWPRDYILDFNNPFTHLALHPKVLDIVSEYLGCWPRLFDMRLWETKVNKGEKKIYSQSWHRDPEDKQLLNLFLYLSDVDEGSGPFNYIPESHIFGKYRDAFPQVLPPQGSYPGDEAVQMTLGKQMKVYTGSEGTIILADTAGLHKGGFSTTKPRIMFKALFVSTGAFKGDHIRYSLPKELPDLTEQQRFAIGLND